MEIANDIIEIGSKLKSEDNQVYISGILTRRDEYNDKGNKVNNILQQRCVNLSLNYIDNSKLIIDKHLNQSGLHLNKFGTKTLTENFLKIINS